MVTALKNESCLHFNANYESYLNNYWHYGPKNLTWPKNIKVTDTHNDIPN